MMTKRKAIAAQRILMDNGIEPSETGTVLQAIGAVIADEDWEENILWENENGILPYTNSVWDPVE